VGDNSDAYPYDAALWEEEDRALIILGSIVVALLVLVAYVGQRK